MRRLTLIASVVLMLAIAGCFGYARTDVDQYELEGAGINGDTAYVDATYHGDESGKAQFKLYVVQDGSRVTTSGTHAREVEAGSTQRFSAPIDTSAVVDGQPTEVGLIIINPVDPPGDGDGYAVGASPVASIGDSNE